MKKRGNNCIAIILVLIALLTSCSDSKEISYEDDYTDGMPLTLYLLPNEILLKEKVRIYNRSVEQHEQIKVEVVNISHPDDSYKLYDRLLDEMLVGAGPDLISVNLLTGKFLDLKKVSEQNVFADMDILIERSESFNKDEYNRNVMDSGIFRGTRVMIPYNYGVDYMVGSKSHFESNNVQIPSNLDIESYCQIMMDYHDGVPEKPAMLGISEPKLFVDFFNENMEVQYSDSFNILCEVIKKESSALSSVDVKESSNFREIYSRYFEGKDLFYEPLNHGTNQYERFYENYVALEDSKRGDFLYWTKPYLQKDVAYAYVQDGLIINANSNKKNAAFKFIEYMLSDEVQRSPFYISLPVNTRVHEELKKGFSEGVDLSILYNLNLSDSQMEMPEHITNWYIEYIDSITACRYLGDFEYIYYNVINQSLEDYYNDYLTYEELVDEINNKLSIYYTE